MTDDKKEMMVNRYQTGDTPWDTGITPPEIVEILKELPTGKALDLGCGTGTNVRYLLEHGWQADGVDFVPQAIERARAKMTDFDAARFRLFVHDVTRLEDCDGLRPPYDMVVDIGCGHGVVSDRQAKYATDVANLLRGGGVLMLYAHAPSAERPDFGWTPDDVRRLYTPALTLVWQVLSDDTSTGMPSGWYRLEKPSG